MRTPLLAFPTRVIRHLLLERSYERYYSAAGWDRSYTEGYVLNTTDQDARYGALLALMRRYDRGGAILDLGCGEGLLEEKYRRLSSSRMLGVDYSQEAIKLATGKTIPACQFVCADYRACEYPEAYGIIVLNESLYYLEDAPGVLRELSRRLSSEGVLIISMFQTLVTRRIWKAVLPEYLIVRSILVQDETHSKAWRIRVCKPKPRLPALEPVCP
jgi:2-polyprenyl-3-methyl-5-hydroxy-6-metoxy-1,4-benzoquinol methylase